LVLKPISVSFDRTRKHPHSGIKIFSGLKNQEGIIRLLESRTFKAAS
jgi:hypothetical protein